MWQTQKRNIPNWKKHSSLDTQACLYIQQKSNSCDVSIFSFQNKDVECVSMSFISSKEYAYIQQRFFSLWTLWNIIYYSIKIYLPEYILHLGNDSVNIRLNFSSTTSFWPDNQKSFMGTQLEEKTTEYWRKVSVVLSEVQKKTQHTDKHNTSVAIWI